MKVQKTLVKFLESFCSLPGNLLHCLLIIGRYFSKHKSQYEIYFKLFLTILQTIKRLCKPITFLLITEIHCIEQNSAFRERSIIILGGGSKVWVWSMKKIRRMRKVYEKMVLGTKLKLARTKPTHQKLARTNVSMHYEVEFFCAWASCVVPRWGGGAPRTNLVIVQNFNSSSLR